MCCIFNILADWYRSPIGRTLVAKTVLIALLFVPTTLALFFHLSRTGSWVAGWVQVGLIGLVSPVMWWRSAVWLRLHRAGKLAGESRGGEGDEPG